MRKDIEIYGVGLAYCSICTPKNTTKEEIIKQVNLEVPTGIGSICWQIHDGPFKTGESNPTPCNDNPDTHLHYLLSC